MTVKVSYYDFGPANVVVAMLIATTKAALVATFFMHLRHDKLFNTLTFLAAFLFLAIFIVFTYDDLGKRGQVDNDYGGTVDPKTGLAAPGGEPATTATINDVEEEAPQGAAPDPTPAPAAAAWLAAPDAQPGRWSQEASTPASWPHSIASHSRFVARQVRGKA